ncbi:MAG: T9SS type A sorting domain-containing protein [Bacteroidetes bacterium]|nr:T9SS type A sorting domain-containing protein [Bacteroidota bacterium]
MNENFADSPHELMTPSIGNDKIIHDPGLALDMILDYGWEFTYIIHTPLANTEDTLQTFEIKAEVTSDLGFDTTSLRLHYSTDAFAEMDSIVQMVPTINPDEYKAIIPNPGKGTELSYYIEVIDDKLRRFTDPGQAPDFVTFGFRIDVDDSIPQIEHTPVSFILENETDVAISASITDFFIGVDTAYIEYSINDVNQASIAMLHDPETFSIYNGTIDLSGGINADDIIKYRIVAIDKSLAQNSSVHPVSGFHEIFVEGIEQPVTEYFNDFNNPTTDFLGDQFTVFTASGFTDGALHSIHPYGEAGLDNSINYITQLKIPIIIDADQHEMRFDEIVLVEPGEPGTVFGNSQFWDYVIVEGSINDGTTWRRLTLGYDSREYDVWDNLYTSRVNSENISTAVGNPTLFRERILDLTDNGLFDPGDTLLIRFRMFADEAAAGWGWAIDNLQIQGEIVAAVEDFLVSTDEFKIFPNPSFNGIYTISATFKKQPTEIRLTVLDMLGKVIMSSKKSGTSLVFNYRLDLSNQPPGIYFVIATLGDDNITRKLIKSQ